MLIAHRLQKQISCYGDYQTVAVPTALVVLPQKNPSLVFFSRARLMIDHPLVATVSELCNTSYLFQKANLELNLRSFNIRPKRAHSQSCSLHTQTTLRPPCYRCFNSQSIYKHHLLLTPAILFGTGSLLPMSCEV